MNDSIDGLLRAHRPYLINLAYQMVGDIGDAEDVVQEAFLRLSMADSGEIEDPRGWLTVVCSRLCLDQVRSARHRRVITTEAELLERQPPVNHSAMPDPGDRVTLDDEVHAALFEVLGRLSAPERVAFVLHDVFAVPFDEIAETVGRPTATCRQLARRARMKIHTAAPITADVDDTEHHLVTERFIAACSNGDLDALTEVLAPDVWGVGTVLADPPPPPQINHGQAAVGANLLRYLTGATLVSGPVGRPVALAFSERRLFAVVVLTIHDGLVAKIEATADPSAR
ncbi:RNA polymerase sigma-70 factor (ECF subfamily) [Mycolicibacterium sp. BK556]|uniref:RNA polymerase sigma factor SigI n=1 Tax=Mycobacteriaceae TaxID=1762 RepID=UPI00105F368B|nr:MULTISPECIES: RNA polymerase sigma factor SigI [Mycobacteriaceae]MBB3600913.1 RNA polymerase sigma-70 factor (ECF subfamily) [Mycolicibacterium sp. BK556]MBB3630667.1 RNA polymerase sigma-70 factor (ECF subfamily) [Mycolicibacterium sp. BK607]MBB3748661.1 RNA polymerase sigma-70 factor (ECF subfamily) [Mycolicibacterium sp. BK634]TDO15148.1 RNA polymerase sigma-70 factor (ECF subfamily) [Mycobacterium sp. BK086]